MTTANWWRGATTYQIYVRSFAASGVNSEGVGDLPGITAKLPYVAELGVDAIWLTPFYPSPMRDYGYDVSDYCDVNELFGSMDDFRDLLTEAHRLGLKVLIDQVYNHCSDKHPWFVESRQDTSNAKADWFVWHDAKADGSPPNNWIAIFGGSAWQWCPIRRQYYLHQFLASQPDLNVNNPEVQEHILHSMRFWLELGVDGFRFDTVNFYCQHPAYPDNPPRDRSVQLSHINPVNPYSMQEQQYNLDQPQNLAFLARIRSLMDQYLDRTSVGEIGSSNEFAVLSAYTQGQQHLHTAYIFALLSDRLTPKRVAQSCQKLEEILGSGWPTWAFSNHDVMRVLSRQQATDQPRAAQMLMVLLGCLRGSVCIYQGEELGLSEAELELHQLHDPFGIEFWPTFKGRDGCRTPMPWDNTASDCGFNIKGATTNTWLPIPEHHRQLAVSVQEPDADSTLNHNRRWLRWRKHQPALIQGSITITHADDSLLVLKRQHGEQSLTAAFNFAAHDLDHEQPGEIVYSDQRSDQQRLAAYGYRLHSTDSSNS